MAKMSAINKNNRRIKLSDKFLKKRKALKKIIMNKSLTLEERFKAQQKLSKMPRNSAMFFVPKFFRPRCLTETLPSFSSRSPTTRI